MKNFKNVVILCLFFVLSIQNSLANVDQTNAFEFEYDCTESGGVLKTDFSLWSHHHYLRHYNINKPGIIEIRDDIHTTVAKSTNISIRGCNFIPETCDITNEWTWEYVEWEDTTFKSLNISTVLDQDFITKSWDVITLEWTGSTDTIDIDFDSPYSGTWRTLALSLLEEKIELVEYFNNEDWTLESNVLREFIFENKQYAWINEFYYDVSDDNKSIIIKKKKFKKVSRGITSSSENSFDIYSASSWQNTGSDTCENPNWESNSSYCTWLDYWDHNQHHYTTTKVKLHAVPLDCTSVTFSWNSGGTTLSSTPYNATLEWLVQPIFSWPILLNWEEADGWNSITLFATDEDVVVKNLLYERVWEIAWNSIAITKIGTSLKKDDITLWSDLFELTTAKSSRWIFDDFRINLKDDLDNILFKKEWEYQLMFTFIGSNDQQVWTYGIPLTIIPNNELKTDGPVTISNSSLFADWVSKTSICQRISDEFGNRIDKDYSVSNTQVAILSEINTDQKNSTWNALSVDNFTFTNSKACFDISSIAPGKKVLKFQLQLPTHILSNTLDLDWWVKNIDIQTESIDFKKIYTWSLKIDELFWITPQTLRVWELYTLSTIATKDNSVTETTTSPVLTITDEISLLDWYIAENQKFI